MEPVPSQEKNSDEQKRGRERWVSLSGQRFLAITLVTMLVAAIIGLIIVASLALINTATLVGGYLKSIPRIMERRETTLAGTGSFYSRDFTVRGDIAVMLYDNGEGDEVIERLRATKEAVGASGVALVDKDGTIIADTETAAAADEGPDTSVLASAQTGTGEAVSEEAGQSGIFDAERLDQVISAEDDLVIISEDPTGHTTVTLDFTATEVGFEGTASEDGGSESKTDDDDESGAGKEEADAADAEAETDGEATADEGSPSEDAAEAEGAGDGSATDESASGWHAVSDEDATDEAEVDTSLYVYYRGTVEDGSTLVVTFDPTISLSVNQEEGQWENLLNKLVAGVDGYSFVRDDATGTWTGIALSDFSETQRKEIEKAMAEVDSKVVHKIPFASDKSLDDVRFAVVWILGNPYLVETRAMPEQGLTFGMVVSFWKFIPGPLRSAIMVDAFVALSVLLLIQYIRMILSGMPDEQDTNKLLRRLREQAHGGLIVITVATSVFCFMTIMLNESAVTARITHSQRESLIFELEHQQDGVTKVLDEYHDASVTQAKALARLISGRPHLHTRQGLQELSEIVGARYLMLFDKAGKEVCSSNSYVGFQIERDADLSVETIVDAPGLQAVLLGEPAVISDAIEDDDGNLYHVIGALVTDAEGLPDGFLVMAVDDPTIDTTYEDDLSQLMNREDQVGLVVDNETGIILKHSDVSKVGGEVGNYLSEDVLGHGYEGYTWYQGRYIYMSSDVRDGESIIVLSLNAIQLESVVALAAMIMLFNAVVSYLFYPNATRYCVSHRREVRRLHLSVPLTVFIYGYSIFFCILSVVTRVSSSRGNWPAFSTVFEGGWSKGINQFSLWSALFFTTQATTALYLVKVALGRIADGTNMTSRTLLRLVDSLITYVSFISIALVDLTWFGVDTTALIASAGILSIAVGMGAKDLIADILSGMFIIFESSVHIGDIVEVGGWRGTITDIGVRTCEITNDRNNVKVVNNSHISELVNFSRNSTYSTLEFDLWRDVPLDDVPETVESIIGAVSNEVPEVSGNLRYIGIADVTDKSYKVKLGWYCDEQRREALTFKLNTVVRMTVEKMRRQRAAEAAAEKRNQ